MTKENALWSLRSVAAESLLKYKARVMGVFGSVARGEETPESDIDVLVDFAENADLFDFVGLSLFLEEKLNMRVDVVPVDTIKSDISGAIMREAIYI